MSKYDQKNQKVNNQFNADKINVELKSIVCPNCQQGNPPKAKFCSECGTSLLFKCPICNSETPLGGKFCSGCGKEISKIYNDIEEAQRRRGGAERELIFQYRTKPRNALDPVSYLITSKYESRMTLEIDEYVMKQETGVVYFSGSSSTKVADGNLYLTNKRLIFLGCDAEDHIVSYDDAYPFSEISNVNDETIKILFLGVSLLKIVWKGKTKKFSLPTDMAKLWADTIRPHTTKTPSKSLSQIISENSDSNSIKCPQCGLPFKTKESLNSHVSNWHK